MKLLFISQNFPYPPYSDGSRIISYHLLKNLSDYCSIYLITFCFDEEREYIQTISPFCDHLVPVTRKKPDNTWRKTKKIILNALDPRRFNSANMTAEIKKAVSQWEPDIAHVDLPMMSQYCTQLTAIPKIIASHDTISISAYKDWKMNKNIFKKAMWFWLYKQRRWIETHYYPQYDACTLVSDEDKMTLSKYSPGLRIEIIPNGVDFNNFSSTSLQSNISKINHSIGLFGCLYASHHIDAALFFHKEIYPLVKRKIKDIKFFIVGRQPPEAIKNLHDNKNVIVTGEVDDIREYYEMISVVISPMRLGSGIKNTVLQAMSMGKPVVATPPAIYAIDAKDNVHAMVAKDAKHFADKIIILLKNKELRESIGNNARDLIINKYSWEYHAKSFHNLYQEILQSKAR